jgi:hypothetical protein
MEFQSSRRAKEFWNKAVLTVFLLCILGEEPWVIGRGVTSGCEGQVKNANAEELCY